MSGTLDVSTCPPVACQTPLLPLQEMPGFLRVILQVKPHSQFVGAMFSPLVCSSLASFHLRNALLISDAFVDVDRSDDSINSPASSNQEFLLAARDRAVGGRQGPPGLKHSPQTFRSEQISSIVPRLTGIHSNTVIT
jgi:hypothetical protein